MASPTAAAALALGADVQVGTAFLRGGIWDVVASNRGHLGVVQVESGSFSAPGLDSWFIQAKPSVGAQDA